MSPGLTLLASSVLLAKLLPSPPPVPTPLPALDEPQGFELGASRETTLRRISGHQASYIPFARMERLEGSVVDWPPSVPSPSWTALFFDDKDNLASVEAQWPIESGPLAELKRELTARYGRPSRTGATDFAWTSKEAKLQIELTQGKWLIDGKYLTVLVLRHSRSR